jgi:hypothetical protein
VATVFNRRLVGDNGYANVQRLAIEGLEWPTEHLNDHSERPDNPTTVNRGVFEMPIGHGRERRSPGELGHQRRVVRGSAFWDTELIELLSPGGWSPERFALRARLLACIRC